MTTWAPDARSCADTHAGTDGGTGADQGARADLDRPRTQALLAQAAAPTSSARGSKSITAARSPMRARRPIVIAVWATSTERSSRVTPGPSSMLPARTRIRAPAPTSQPAAIRKPAVPGDLDAGPAADASRAIDRELSRRLRGRARRVRQLDAALMPGAPLQP